jgi:hypothetical protein
MRITHVTPTRNVEPILTEGFHPDRGHDFADRALFGDEMFDGEEGPFSAISIDIPDSELAEYKDEQFKDHHPDHEEWIQIPGELLNKYLDTAQVEHDPGSPSSESSE